MSIVKLNNRAVSNASSFGSISSLGEMKFISKATASSSASIEFTLGDYKEYQFYFVNMHPATDGVQFEFNLSTDSGSTYAVTKTSTWFMSYIREDDAGGTALTYDTSFDLAQSTANQRISNDQGNGNDESCSGYMYLFNPSSTTYVKHFMTEFHGYNLNNYAVHDFSAGYGNTTSALTNIKFQMSSGNIDAGSILMFGIN